MIFETFGLEEIERHGVKITGIIHIGAHYGEEQHEYATRVGKNVVWFEADAKCAGHMLENLQHTGQIGVHALLTDEDDKEYTWYEQSFDPSSSILEPGLINEIQHNHYVAATRPIFSKTFKTIWPQIVAENNLNSGSFNFLVLDTQGSELMVLNGIGDYINQFDAIVSEYSNIEYYKNVPKLKDIDLYLQNYNFERTYPDGVGEFHAIAAYIKRG